jgi:MFS family permease
MAADRLDRRKLIIAAQAGMMLPAILLAALVLTGRVAVWHVMVLAGISGLAHAFDAPARQSFFVEMVGKNDLMNAIALNSSTFNVARMIGPAVAGVTVAAVGEGWCFFLNGVSFLAVLAGLMRIRTAGSPPHRVSGASDVLAGFRYAWNTGPIRALLALLGAVGLFGVQYVVLLPVFADSILHAGPRGLGWLTSAAGMGAVAGALRVAARAGVRGLGRWVMLASAGFGLSLVLFGASRQLWLSAALLLPVGFMILTQTAATNSLIQTMVADEYRGRVMALYSMMLMGMAPFGSFLAGAVADRLGAPSAVMLGGLLCLASALVFWWRWRALRGEARRLVQAQMGVSPAPEGDDQEPAIPPQAVTGSGPF